MRTLTGLLAVSLSCNAATTPRLATTTVALSISGTAVATPAATGGFMFTVNGSGTASPFGQLTFTGQGNISDIVSLVATSPIIGTLVLTFLPGGDKLNMTFTIPAGVLIPSIGFSTSANGFATVTGGSGQFVGATGSFPVLTGSGTATGSNSSSFQIQGPGTVVTPNPTGSPVITKAVDRATGTTRLAPGVPMEITGTGLGTGATDAPAFTVAGKPAPILSFISPLDVVVQIPVDAAAGPATLVATYKGVNSPPFSIVLDTFMPAIYGPASAGGSAFYSSAGRPITSANPAAANQQIYAVASGLGPTTPIQVANTIATVPSPGNAPVQVMVGSKLIVPDYAGLFVGGSPGTYQVLFKLPADVALGDQPVVISVSGRSSNTATLTVGPPVPIVNAIVNGASFRAKPVAPNSFVSIFGLNFGAQDTPASIFPATSFNDVSVLFNGVPTQLYFVFGSLGQINLVVPPNLPETGTVMVQVKTTQGTSAPFPLQMAAADVGLFRIPDPSKSTRNNGAILFSNTVWRVMPASMAKAIGFPTCDGGDPAIVCGQPAASGDSIQIFLTGLGKATPDGDPAGQPLSPGSVAPINGVPLYRTVLLPAVKIGGLATPVVFSGITPGNAGLYQINVTVPDGVPIGDDVSIEVTMPNGSTDTVTIGTRTR